MNLRERLGVKLREYRERRGWTQAEAADYLGVTANHYACCERGEATVQQYMLRLLNPGTKG